MAKVSESFVAGQLMTASSFGPEHHRGGSTWGMQRREVFCFSFLFAHKQIAADDTVTRLPGLTQGCRSRCPFWRLSVEFVA